MPQDSLTAPSVTPPDGYSVVSSQRPLADLMKEASQRNPVSEGPVTPRPLKDLMAEASKRNPPTPPVGYILDPEQKILSAIRAKNAAPPSAENTIGDILAHPEKYPQDSRITAEHVGVDLAHLYNRSPDYVAGSGGVVPQPVAHPNVNMQPSNISPEAWGVEKPTIGGAISTLLGAQPVIDVAKAAYGVGKDVITGGKQVGEGFMEDATLPGSGLLHSTDTPERRAARMKMAGGAAKVITGVATGALMIDAPAIANTIAAATAGDAAATLALSKIAAGFIGGAGASAGAGAAAEHYNLTPEAKELLQTSAFFIPALLGDAIGLKSGVATTPEGDPAAAASAFGGRVGVAGVKTPEAYEVRAGVKGGPNVGVRIPRSGTATDRFGLTYERVPTEGSPQATEAGQPQTPMQNAPAPMLTAGTSTTDGVQPTNTEAPISAGVAPESIITPPTPETARARTNVLHRNDVGEVRQANGQAPTVWLSPTGWKSFMGTLYPEEDAAATHGVNLPANNNFHSLATDAELGKADPTFAQVQGLLAQAHQNANGGGVAIAKTRPSLQANVNVMREELNHTWQRSLTGKIINHLTQPAFTDLYQHIPSGMYEHLIEHGYDGYNSPEIVTESAAKLMDGRPERFGVTNDDAIDFLDRYFKAVSEQHGAQALESLQHVRGIAADAKTRAIEEHGGTNSGQDNSTVPSVAAGGPSGVGEGISQPAFNRGKVEDEDKDFNPIQFARTAEGKVKLGADPAALGKILGSSLYQGEAPKIITKELVQNAMDAVRQSTGDKNVKVEIFNGSYPRSPSGTVVPHPDNSSAYAIKHPNGDYVTNEAPLPPTVKSFYSDYNAQNNIDKLYPQTGKDNAIRITDTGKGMTKNELETVFTDLGASGKRDLADASGGFGIAKAAPMMMSKNLEVSTVVNEDGKLMRHWFTATPNDLLGEGVDIHSEVLPPNSAPTGTIVTSILPPDANMYGTAGFLRDSGRSLRPPGSLQVFENGREQKYGTEGEMGTPVETRAVPGASLDLYTSNEKRTEPTSNYSSIVAEIHNNGIYQFSQHLNVPPGIRGFPKRVAVDVKASVPEGDPNYPFTANREQLHGDQIDKEIKKFVKEKILDPIIEKHKASIKDLYWSFPKIDGYIPFFDSGMRMTPEETQEIMSNPAIKEIADSIMDLTATAGQKLANAADSDYALDGLGARAKRVGIIMSDAVHGVHITNPEDKSHATIFINPFDKEENTPDAYASLMWHTIQHELVHDKVSGHNESFTTSFKNVSRALGGMNIKALTELRDKYADPNDSNRIRPDFNRALQIYRESRARDESTPDIFGGEEIRAELDRPEGEGHSHGGVSTSGEGPVPEWNDALFSREKDDKPIWYLKSERLINEKMKGPQPAGEVQKMLLAGGIKPDEMHWTGLDDFLRKNWDKKVTPEQIKEHLANNNIQIKEVMNGGTKPVEWKPYKTPLGDVWHTPEGYNIEPLPSGMFRLSTPAGMSKAFETLDQAKAEVDRYRKNTREDTVPTRHATYVLPGGENYREMLLALPHTDYANSEIAKARSDLDRIGLPENDPAAWEEASERYRAAMDNQHGVMGGTPVFQSTHWDEPNILAHIRFNDRSTLTYTPEDIKRIEGKIQEAMPNYGPASWGSGATKLAVGKGLITPEEAAQYAQSNGWSYEFPRVDELRRKIQAIKDKYDALSHQETVDDVELIKKLRARGMDDDEIDSYLEQPNRPNYKEAIDKEVNPLREELAKEISKPNPSERKLLHVEEIQSDWHQKGRDVGYEGDFKPLTELPEGYSVKSKKFDSGPDIFWVNDPQGKPITQPSYNEESAKNAALNAINDEARGTTASPVPDAPFKKTWHEMALRRILKHAVDNNYDGVSWTPGADQNARYSLSKQVDKIAVPMVNKNGSRSVRIDPLDGGHDSFKMMVSPDGTVDGMHSASQFTGKKLDEVIGKELAKKIMDIPHLDVESMKKGDRVTVERHGKQVEVTVDPERRLEVGKPREAVMVTSTDGKQNNWYVPLSEFNSRSFSGEGLEVGGSGMKGFYDKIIPDYLNKFGKRYGAKVGAADIQVGGPKHAMEYSDDDEPVSHKTVQYLPITPEMRNSISGEGMPLFNREIDAKAAPKYNGGSYGKDDTTGDSPREVQRRLSEDAFGNNDAGGKGVNGGVSAGEPWTYTRKVHGDDDSVWVLGAPVRETWSLNPEQKDAIRKRGWSSPDIHELEYSNPNSAAAFHHFIKQIKDFNKFGASVHVYSQEEYGQMRMFLSGDGKSGFALRPDGDIVSVFSHGEEAKGSSHTMLEIAKQAGGTKMDAFDTVLPKIYGGHGFRAVARMKWNDEYAPEGWDKETFKPFNDGEPDVVFMVRDPAAKPYQTGDGKTTDDYDEAVRLQQEAIDENKVKEPENWVKVGAQDFAQQHNRAIDTSHYLPVDPRAKDVADAYEAMKDDPSDPKVAAAYKALVKEAREQWDHATKKMGVTFEGWNKPGQPYQNSKEMIEDVKNNHHLYFFRGGDDLSADHPMGAIYPDTGLSGRDTFRAVHDLFGHAAEGFQFGPRGEENAWNAHRQMFSEDAIPALTALTKGQNSWVNYGPHMRDAKGNLLLPGQPGWVDLKDRPYPPQKVGILPKEFQSRPDVDADDPAFNREKPDGTLYHVTETKNVPKILKDGLQRFKTSNWTTRNGERYGKGEVYTFTNKYDAIRWAARMDWELNKKSGSGKISIVRINPGKEKWDTDHSDPLSQSGKYGDWLKSESAIPASQIIDSFPVGQDEIKDLVDLVQERRKSEDTTFNREKSSTEGGSGQSPEQAEGAGKAPTVDNTDKHQLTHVAREDAPDEVKAWDKDQAGKWLGQKPSLKITSQKDEELDPKSLKTTQSWAGSFKLKQFHGMDASTAPPISVLRTDDGDYIVDGVHRAARAAQDGSKVKATVYTVKMPDRTTTVPAPGAYPRQAPAIRSTVRMQVLPLAQVRAMAAGLNPAPQAKTRKDLMAEAKQRRP